MLALTHLPSPTMHRGQRTYVARSAIDYETAVKQHAEYCSMVQRLGVQVRMLDVNRELSDCAFIEDTAIVLDEIAVLASMGAESRGAEPGGIEPVLREYRVVRRIEPPATLEGGDVLQVGRTLLIGLSGRTNQAGINALETIVRRYRYRVVPVPVRKCLHLKTACTALPDGTLLVNPAWVEMEDLRGFETIGIPKEEPWGANTLTIGRTVCLPAAHVRTADLVRERGFEVETVELSEFAKAEGGITCLSIVLNNDMMPVRPSFEDEVLGRVTWNAEENCWKFEVGPINNEFVSATYFPEDSRLPPTEQGWDRIRACVLWLRANEPAVRALVTDKAEQGSAPNVPPLEPLELSGVIFYKNQEARLIYWGDFQTAMVQVDGEGLITAGPIWLNRT